MSVRLLLLAALAALAPGCCFGELPLAAPDPQPSGPAAPPPPTDAPDPSAGPSGDCLALCRRRIACAQAGGDTLTADELDCGAACGAGGRYTNMPAEAFACARQSTCEHVDVCMAQSLAAMFARQMGAGGVVQMPAPAVPASWPEHFPVVPGGQPIPAPATGPVRVAVLSYAGMRADDLETSYRGALAAAGWDVTDSDPSPEARRFRATRERVTVAVSIRAAGSAAIIQTMQF